MPFNLYKLDCPRCGPVEGYAETELAEEDSTVMEGPPLIEEQEFESSAGIARKFRCPQCGRWVDADRIGPV